MNMISSLSDQDETVISNQLMDHCIQNFHLGRIYGQKFSFVGTREQSC